MPKSQNINPKVVRKPQFIEFGKIPVNQYNKTISEEKINFTSDDFMRIYHDMVIIREFETMLNLIKTTNEYNGIHYNHPGPAHLSIGQEASAVGMAYTLDSDDYIFGSHRSHGEILAKGLSAIHKLDEDTLYSIMKNYFGGAALRVVEKGFPGLLKSWQYTFCCMVRWLKYLHVKTDSTKDLAVQCMHSSLLLEYIRTMPLSEDRVIFQ